jgi:hypothetical protein
MLSHQSKNYAQAVSKAKKQSVQRMKESLTPSVSNTVAVLKPKLVNENGVYKYVNKVKVEKG